MDDPGLPLLTPAWGQDLRPDAYKRDFRRERAEAVGRESWMFERRQHVEERHDPSRDALRRGDWPTALRLLERKRTGLRETARRDRANGTAFHRVRVVERPLTPYVQWELHALRIQAESGKRIRVVDAARVRTLEDAGQLPGVIILGGRTLYRPRYTADGIPDGATKFTDPGLVRPWERFLTRLYADGEDVIPYVDRVVAPLPPPRLRAE
jgi:hypothetical protein